MLGCPWRCVCSVVDNDGPCSARVKPRSGLILMISSAALIFFFFKQEAMMHRRFLAAPQDAVACSVSLSLSHRRVIAEERWLQTIQWGTFFLFF
ncbi:hypothetical protein DM01DRAFT_140808 [Hesseltinella vesiculosa]|uniref:Uncharacterized protein n=1 Tax=Hesseltinella vesiculosa TaxID=101127 RepID=A0A1X2G8W8_9FUNG|nr:hypothetical protein DM01DRAFT_140808 [Hesseltinella vesiculosa]